MRFNKLILLLLSFSILESCNDFGGSKFEVTPPTNSNTEIVELDSLDLNRTKGLMILNDKPFTGTAIFKYPNGTMAIATDYKEGKKNGLDRKWFENGDLSYQAQYHKGKLNGKVYTWWSNGNLRTESNYVNGVAEGVQLQYYQSGVKFKKINLVDGQEEGLQQSWRENDKIYNNYEAKNGRIFGLKRSKLCFQLDDEEVQY